MHTKRLAKRGESDSTEYRSACEAPGTTEMLRGEPMATPSKWFGTIKVKLTCILFPSKFSTRDIGKKNSSLGVQEAVHKNALTSLGWGSSVD